MQCWVPLARGQIYSSSLEQEIAQDWESKIITGQAEQAFMSNNKGGCHVNHFTVHLSYAYIV